MQVERSFSDRRLDAGLELVETRELPCELMEWTVKTRSEDSRAGASCRDWEGRKNQGAEGQEGV